MTETVNYNDSVEIVVNGEGRRVPRASTIAEVLASIGAPREGCAVEKNGRIIARSLHSQERVEGGDKLEIVTFVGGG